MKSDWKLVKIGDVGEVIGGGTPSTKNESYYGDEIPWITPKDLSGYSKKYISKGERSITRTGLENSSAKLLPKNTVLLSSRAPIGYVAIAANEMTTNQGFKSIICNEDMVTFDYMYYVLKSSKDKLEAVASGSTFKEVSGKVVKDFEILIPDIMTQNKITNILNSLDEKIECNMDIIKNLEEFSQTLFKHWFIDFEFPNVEGLPYKSSGGEMVDSELGEIPKDWVFKNLVNICEVKDGTHDSPKQVEEGYPLVTSKHLRKNSIDFATTKLISFDDYEKVNKRSLVERFDILISMIGTVGRLYLVQDKFIEFAIKNIGLIKTSQIDDYEFIYCYLQSESMKAHIEERMAGSTQQYISLTELRKIPVLMPSKEVLKIFKDKVHSLFEMIYSMTVEIHLLEELRDTLLPKLLSGEIEVPDESVAD